MVLTYVLIIGDHSGSNNISTSLGIESGGIITVSVETTVDPDATGIIDIAASLGTVSATYTNSATTFDIGGEELLQTDTVDMYFSFGIGIFIIGLAVTIYNGVDLREKTFKFKSILVGREEYC